MLTQHVINPSARTLAVASVKCAPVRAFKVRAHAWVTGAVVD